MKLHDWLIISIFASIFIFIGAIGMYFHAEYKYGEIIREAELRDAYITGQISICEPAIRDMINHSRVSILNAGG